MVVCFFFFFLVLLNDLSRMVNGKGNRDCFVSIYVALGGGQSVFVLVSIRIDRKVGAELKMYRQCVRRRRRRYGQLSRRRSFVRRNVVLWVFDFRSQHSNTVCYCSGERYINHTSERKTSPGGRFRVRFSSVRSKA